MLTQNEARIIERLKPIERSQERGKSLEYSRTLGEVYAEFTSLPGLVGFWPMSSVQRSTGNAYDLSGQGRTLTYNGNPTYNIHNSLIPYIDLDGTGDFLSRADETDLDILGNEAIYAAAVRGLATGGWFWLDSTVGNREFVTKHDGTVAGSAFALDQNGGASKFSVYSGAVVFNSPTQVIATGAWYFLAGVYVPSTSLSLFQNGIRSQLAAGVPAAINNSAAGLNIGATSGVNLLDGRAALCFLCANALSDLRIQRLFNVTRPYFGV